MGCKFCKKSKPAEDGESKANAGAPVSKSPTVSKSRGDNKEKKDGKTRLEREAIESILLGLNASEMQRQFYQDWHKIVGDAVVRHEHINELRFTSDGSCLEQQLTADVETMMEVAEKLARGRAVEGGSWELTEGPAAHLAKLVDSLTRRPERVGMWCRLKRIGKSHPAIDAGYTVRGIVRWVEVDMLMPPCEDLEVLRDWAQEHGWTACNFGRSFFPTEPEHRITFQVNDTNKQKSKELVNSFFFFKALGFVITPQPVVQAISSCEPLDFTVQACLGPKGLTRLAVKIFYPKKESIYQMICGGARIPFEKSKSDMVSANLGGHEPHNVEFGADANGYICNIGWTTETRDNFRAIF